jgi:hypothetical protein
VRALAGIVAVAAAATLGDFIWYTVGVRHTMLAGITHGALLLTAVGGAIGAASGRLVKGLPLGALAGIGGALSYYVLAALPQPMSEVAMTGAWVVMWLLLAMLDARWIRQRDTRSTPSTLQRGMLAAVGSGLVFALLVPFLWGRSAGGERNYPLQFVLWSCAWAPGLLALTLHRTRGAR